MVNEKEYSVERCSVGMMYARNYIVNITVNNIVYNKKLKI